MRTVCIFCLLIQLSSCQTKVDNAQAYIKLAHELRQNANILEMTGHVKIGNTLNGQKIIVKAEEYDESMADEGIYYYLEILRNEGIPTQEYKTLRNDMIKLEVEQYLRKQNHSILISHVADGVITGYAIQHGGETVDEIIINSRYTARLGKPIKKTVFPFKARRGDL